MASAPTMDALIREAKKEGFEIEEDGLRIRFRSPLGDSVLLPRNDPGDRHAMFNNRARLRHIGLGNLPAPQPKSIPNESENNDQMAQVSELVEQHLRSHPNRVFTNGQVAMALNLNRVQVSNSLRYLADTRPEIENVERGAWRFSDGGEPVVEPQRPVRVVKPSRTKKAPPVVSVVRSPRKKAAASVAPPVRQPKADKSEVALRSQEQASQDVEVVEVVDQQPEPQPVLERLIEPVVPSTPVPQVVVASVPPIQVAASPDLPSGMPSLFQAIGVHRSGAVILLDENGDLWLAHAMKVTAPAVTMTSTV